MGPADHNNLGVFIFPPSAGVLGAPTGYHVIFYNSVVFCKPRFLSFYLRDARKKVTLQWFNSMMTGPKILAEFYKNFKGTVVLV